MKLQDKISEILNLADLLDWGDPNYDTKESQLWNMVTQLDKATSIEGTLRAGNFIRFGVADGYANYIITKVLTYTVEVVQLPVGDNWSFEGAYYNTKGALCLPRPVAQEAHRRQMAYDKIFA